MVVVVVLVVVCYVFVCLCVCLFVCLFACLLACLLACLVGWSVGSVGRFGRLVGWLVVVVAVMGFAGRAGCLSLLLVKSLSTASHLKLSSAVVSQVVSLVSSVGPVWL